MFSFKAELNDSTTGQINNDTFWEGQDSLFYLISG